MTILTRRRALLGLLAAPAIIRTPGLLMPIKAIPTLDAQAIAREQSDLWVRREWRIINIDDWICLTRTDGDLQHFRWVGRVLAGGTVERVPT